MVSESFSLHGVIPFVPVNLNHEFSNELPGDFDAVTAIEVVEHLENPRHFLRQCRGLLASGGHLLLSTPNIEDPASLERFLRKGSFRLFGDKYYESTGHTTPIGQWQLRKMLAEAGFEQVELSGFARRRGARISTRVEVPLVFRIVGRQKVADLTLEKGLDRQAG